VTTEIATFAVVGRVNKGKSSIVSTLVEDESVRVDKRPGTTRRCEEYELRVSGKVLCRLVDTPGFEDAPRALAWMRAREGSAADRSRIVESFVAEFRDGEEFQEECALLEPILAGAGILYVVDASRPYRPNYEAEMEILQWTGRPRLALINTISDDDHVEEWRRALDQYFSIVRVFDAHEATFADRVGLLRAFRELREDRHGAIDAAIADLEAEWNRRRRETAAQIADLLIDALTFSVEWSLAEGERPDAHREEWLDRFYDGLRARESKERAAIETLYRHERVERRESGLDAPIFERDLFAATSWRVLGLDTWQLVRAGVVGGAAIGGAIDLGTGGASFLAGSLVGGVLGGLSSYYGGKSVAQIAVLGRRLGGPVARIGPLTNPNFPWLLLDRALLHYKSTVRRAHARRDVFVVDGGDGKAGVVTALGPGEQARLTKMFARIRGQSPDLLQALRDELAEALVPLLESSEKRPS